MNLLRLFTYVFFFLLSVFFLGCAQTTKEGPTYKKAAIAVQPKQTYILNQIDKTSNPLALHKLTKTYPDTLIAHKAFFRLGQIFKSQGKYKNAVHWYQKITTSDVYSFYEIKAYEALVEIAIKAQKYNLAVAFVDKAASVQNIPLPDKISLLEQKLQIVRNWNKEEYLKTASLIKKHGSSQFKEIYQQEAETIINEELSKVQLLRLAKQGSASSFLPEIHFRLGNLALEEKNLTQANTFFKRVSTYPQASQKLIELASWKILGLQKNRRVNRKTVGVILDFDKRYKKNSEKFLNGLKLGLSLYSGFENDIKLIILDSEGDPELAKKHVEELVLEEQIMVIVGGFLTRTAQVIAEITDQYEVPFISSSQKSSLTDLGDYVFQNALNSKIQIRTLLRHLELEKIRKVGFLYPNDNYGIEFTNLFWDEILARGGEVRGAQAYTSDEKDFSGQVRRLFGTFYLDDREEELKKNLVDWFEESSSRPRRLLLKPEIDFDALFIPAGVKSLGQIVGMLSYQDVENLTLLGTNLWNTPSLHKRAGRQNFRLLFPDINANLSTSWFAKHFMQQYGYKPHLLEAYGYDAGLMVRYAIKYKKSRTRQDFARHLKSMPAQKGSLGSFQVAPEGHIARDIQVFTLQNGRKVIATPDLEYKERKNKALVR